ncbi:acyltransferase family protein [Deminuibacter soli]|uniref:Acyltransferase n=1 Tax=Deminuibacter soli TaxID=2291815 RepID=A0A3E1NMP6_9BACT|nr:acyltransferase [Deminuibacter soli]RFM29088.1 acyltransferase [Deminuibacter soli]
MHTNNDRDNWLDYLRAFITLLVVAHHSSLAYTTFASFNKAAYITSTHPVVDTLRSSSLDIFEDFNDVFFMSLMFLIGGIFLWNSIAKKGRQQFLRDRFRRLFVPFVIGVTLLMLLAYYPAWLLAHGHTSPKAYIVDFFTVEAWPVGPPWFLWVLFLFNGLLACTYPYMQKGLHQCGIWLARQTAHTVFICWYILGWILYVPAALYFGADAWTGIGPFDFQQSRLLLYAGYFILGVGIGAPGLHNSLFTAGNRFMKKWPLWLLACAGSYVLLKCSAPPLLHSLDTGQLNNIQATLIYRSIWILSCTCSSIAFITAFRQLFHRSYRLWQSLAGNAYGIYLVHYVFVIWLQYYLLRCTISPVSKFLVCTIASILLSWAATWLLRKNKLVRKLL